MLIECCLKAKGRYTQFASLIASLNKLSSFLEAVSENIISKYIYFAPKSFKALIMAACQVLFHGHLPTLEMSSSLISITIIRGEKGKDGRTRKKKSELASFMRFKMFLSDKVTTEEATVIAIAILKRKDFLTFNIISNFLLLRQRQCPLPLL